MTFASVSFAETSFAADQRTLFDIIGSFPIFPLNGDTLTFVMSLNFITTYDLAFNTEIDAKGLINTQIDTKGNINTQQDHRGKINRQTDFNFVR